LIALPKTNLALASSGILILPIAHQVKKCPPSITSADIENLLVLHTLGLAKLDDREAIVVHPSDGGLDI
jgi:hypothetical protein